MPDLTVSCASSVDITRSPALFRGWGETGVEGVSLGLEHWGGGGRAGKSGGRGSCGCDV